MSPKVTIPRKKSCGNCFKSKLRCDLRKPSCTRCENRKWDCAYTTGANPPSEEDGAEENDNLSGPPSLASQAGRLDLHAKYIDPQANSPSSVPRNNRPNTSSHITSIRPSEILDFSGIQLICTVDAHRIRVRWLESLLPSIDQRPKPFQPATMSFIGSIFKSYPSMFVAGDCPPFIHWSQVKGKAMCLPLENCMNISRMWTAQTAGSADMVREVIEQEMHKLFEKRAHCGHLELLATFQAYLLYAIMLFSSTLSTGSIRQDIIMRLQELAGDAAGKGTLCYAETEGTRPDWESWIIASAKRRTLFATSLFDNLVNFSQGSPSFAAVELAGLPAPASKALWNAQTRESWNRAYNQQLSHSGDGELLISDLWPHSQANSEALQPKIDRWLSSVDEFGMMIYAVTSHTYKHNDSCA
ncbi:hypothetical protein PV04_02637 [Phialophora macrospora]|uniref:Zn(2)-C6 fungal-type domain-containing protein n=1 Tax=Phialophora macrospora TaxID=1851006 RepID=A0A0D2E7S1_9EURO|nr:hypothetical protein PV04_02637 [Phialophora macrospora]